MIICRKLSAIALMLVLVGSGIAQKDTRMSPSLSSLVEAERAFARTSVEKGVRASFIEFFADDGIGFQPEPTRIRETYLKLGIPATRPPVTLDWQPVYADVALAGDLGYTTGPYTFTDQSSEKKSARYGYYFSVWKKQTGGAWKVALDCGISTPDHSNQKLVFTAARETKRKTTSRKVNLEAERNALMEMDRAFLNVLGSIGIAGAFLEYLDETARVHRNNMFPVTNKKALGLVLSRTDALSWKPISSDVSLSGDLGYTYGSYELKYRDGDREAGYYVRVWKRNARGQWKVVLDTQSPVPPEKN